MKVMENGGTRVFCKILPFAPKSSVHSDPAVVCMYHLRVPHVQKVSQRFTYAENSVFHKLEHSIITLEQRIDMCLLDCMQKFVSLV